MADSKDRKFDPDLFKKFFKIKDKGGFIAIRPWFEAGKISVDIGETAAGGGLASNTLVWVPALPFAAYLKAIATGTAEKNYKDEEFIYYGGGKTDQGPVSRILKVAHWPNDFNGNFQFKTGMFKAKESNTGAFVPDMNSPLGQNLIKVTRAEVVEISYVVDLAITAFTATDNWLSHINGKERG